jgi:hypothetical protein
VPVIVLLVLFPICVTGARTLLDFRVWKRWRSLPRAAVTGETILSSLGELRTERFRTRYLRFVLRDTEVANAKDAELMLTELASLVEKEWLMTQRDLRLEVSGESQGGGGKLSSPAITWYVKQTHSFDRKLGWRDDTVDGLFRVVEKLRAADPRL